MAIITRPIKTGGGTDYVAGNDELAEEFNADANTIYNDYNGNVTDANCSAIMALQGTKLADAPLGVPTAKINDSAVTTAKINDLAVTGAKIAVSTIPTEKFKNLVTESVAFTTNFGVGFTAKIVIPYRFTSGANYIGKVLVWAQDNATAFLSSTVLTVTPLTAIPTATKDLIAIYLDNVTLAGSTISGNLIFVSIDKA